MKNWKNYAKNEPVFWKMMYALGFWCLLKYAFNIIPTLVGQAMVSIADSED